MSRIFKNKISLVLFLALLLSLCGGLHAVARERLMPENWLTSLPQAQEKARSENKLLLAFFTGSDWCGFCHRLEDEVFFTPEFREWSNSHAVVLYLDFPKLKAPDPALAQQNNELLQKYGISGFPSVLFFNTAGEPLVKLGYIEGGADNWLEKAKMMLPKRLETEKNFTLAYFKASRERKPLLTVATIGKYDPQVNAMVDKLLNEKALTLNSGDNLLITRLDLAAAESEELGLWRNLSATSGVGKNYPVLLLVDAAYSKLWSVEGKAHSAAAMGAEIAEKLPKPQYNGGWLTNYPKAQRIARALNRPLLLNFTGSDWCKYCDLLADEVYKTPEFLAYANKNLVLVELDYPKRKNLSPEIMVQNQIIAEAFGISSFPLEVIMQNSNTPVASFGYTGAKPAQIIDLIEKAAK